MHDTTRPPSDAVIPDPEPHSPSDPTATRAARGRSRATLLACFLACLAFAIAVMWRFHDEQWNGFDDGAYLHVADRMVHGEVLHRDVQDIHLGYINFVNAWALRLFGDDAVSLRYPLLAMGVAGAALAFWLLADAGPAYATAVSVAVTSLSLPQFMNPTANWYCLYLCLVILAVMKWAPRQSAARHVTLGLLVAMVVMFRQISGVFAAAAVLFYLLFELSQPVGVGTRARLAECWIAKALLAVTGLGLTFYLLRNTDVTALLLYGVWPLAALAWGIVHVSARNGDAIRLLLRLSVGGALAALPLVAYHVHHGSVRPWLDDTVFTALGFTRNLASDRYRYWRTIASGVRSVLRPRGVVPMVTGAFWAVAPLVPTLVGAAVVRALWTGRPRGPVGESNPDAARPTSPRLPVTPLAVLAVFYFLVALHLQKFLYFFFAAPLCVMALVEMLSALRPVYRRTGLGAVFGMSLVGLLFFPAPFRRLIPGLGPLVPPSEHRLPRCSIHLDAWIVEEYKRINELVDREVPPGEPILALPASPELYYLTGRRNPTRFSYSILDLHSDADVTKVEQKLEHSPPRLVFYNPKNTFNTKLTRELMEWVVERTDDIGQFGAFRVYRWRAAAATPSTRAAGRQP